MRHKHLCFHCGTAWFCQCDLTTSGIGVLFMCANCFGRYTEWQYSLTTKSRYKYWREGWSKELEVKEGHVGAPRK